MHSFATTNTKKSKKEKQKGKTSEGKGKKIWFHTIKERVGKREREAERHLPYRGQPCAWQSEAQQVRSKLSACGIVPMT